MEFGSYEEMIDLVKKFFGKSAEGRSENKTTERPHDIRIATCALFLEMANIDEDFTQPERDRILGILKREYHLSDEHADALVEASTAELKRSIDYWRFTNLINQNYSIDEKIRIIETVWSIAYTDGKLDKHEDYLVHKLANLLNLTHKQLIDAKLKTIHDDVKKKAGL